MLYLLKKVLVPIKGTSRNGYISGAAIAISATKSELESLKDLCESFERTFGMSRDYLNKHPAGFVGHTFCLKRGHVYYEIMDITISDEFEMLVFEAEVKAVIVKKSDECREYINRVKKTNYRM